MNLNYLYGTEQKVIYETNKIYGVGRFDLERSIELLLNSSHFLQENIEFNSSEYIYYIFVFYNYLKLPYTLRSIIILWEKGYYLESNILIRSILEGLLQIKYFYSHKNSLNDHLLNRKRISFKTMFKELLPDLYDSYYNNLSGFSHSKLITSIFRENRKSAEISEIIHGCKFNLKYSGSIISQTIGLAYAHLNFIDIFFPSFYSKIDTNLKIKIKYYLSETRKKLIKNLNTQSKNEFWERFFNFIDNKHFSTE